jgi:hypothetical protein
MSIIFLALFAPIAVAIAVNATQYAALMQFLTDARARSITFNQSQCPPQTSYPTSRIACNADGGISQLQLYLAVLNGNLSSNSLMQLTDLRYLNLSNNNLVGPIDALAKLSGLTMLDVSYNALTGDALSVVQQLPNLTDCVLQALTPEDTNCFTGFVAANASLCNDVNANPLYLCRVYKPRITTTLAPSPTTTNAPSTTTTVTTIMTTSPPSSSSMPTTTTTKMRPTSTAATTSITESSSHGTTTTNFMTTALEKISSQKPSAPAILSSASMQQQQQQHLVIVVLSVIVALLYVAFAAYFVVRKLRQRREEEHERRLGLPSASGPLLSATELLSVSDRETDDSQPIVNVAKSEYGPIHLPPEQPSDGYSNLPALHLAAPREKADSDDNDSDVDEKIRKRTDFVPPETTKKAALPPPFVIASAPPLQEAHNYDRVPAPLNGSGSSAASDGQHEYDGVKVKQRIIYDIVKVPSARTVYDQCESSLT